LSFLKAGALFLLGLVFLAGCATTKPYRITSGHPNLTVQIHMEDGSFQREIADLYIYEVRGKCEQFYHGFVALKEGSNSVTLPLGMDLIIYFMRTNASIGHSLTNEDSFRFRPQAGQQYRLRLRERNGSREVLFMSKARGGEFREFGWVPMPKCEKSSSLPA